MPQITVAVEIRVRHLEISEKNAIGQIRHSARIWIGYFLQVAIVIAYIQGDIANPAHMLKEVRWQSLQRGIKQLHIQVRRAHALFRKSKDYGIWDIFRDIYAYINQKLIDINLS